MKKLQASCNNDASKIVKEAAHEKNTKENFNIMIDLAMIASNTKPTKDEPWAFGKAWNHPNAESWSKWQETTLKEFNNMNKQQVWWKMHKLMPPKCRCIKNKWIF